MNQFPMKQKSIRHVNFQPTENLVEICSESYLEEMLHMSGPPKLIPKKGNGAGVVESGSKTDASAQDGKYLKKIAMRNHQHFSFCLTCFILCLRYSDLL